MSPSSSAVPASSKTTTARIVVVVVELRCFLCADTIGTLEMDHWPSFGPARLRTTPAAPSVAIADWTGLRCARCGGNVYPDEISTTSVHPPVSWDDLERPRRGRPPKLLAAQRQAAGDAECN
jgi:hypothetical protein